MKKYKVTVQYKDKGEACVQWKLYGVGRDEVSDNLIFKQRPEDLKEETVISCHGEETARAKVLK